MSPDRTVWQNLWFIARFSLWALSGLLWMYNLWVSVRYFGRGIDDMTALGKSLALAETTINDSGRAVGFMLLDWAACLVYLFATLITFAFYWIVGDSLDREIKDDEIKDAAAVKDMA